MELKINLNYRQILNLIKQLPEEEKKKLAVTLQSDMSSNTGNDALKGLILEAPTWANDDYSLYKDARDSINNSRLA
ncbi:MAG: hypothetical protein K9G67_15855 [Bacteroidales bacterium]|nr:hypothetical protein [Bacteroidales bacterium]MCF8344235.1 hypothetical protein [Bacteroidales bacterium]MCF8351944.1 hypothetical protein [Bacteroidales bacterium]MCF8377830.1 hypothetical protein [Bacteroidales bacterium]MCF8401315.1 hypothetical protein [Bacteroidales bacterium]